MLEVRERSEDPDILGDAYEGRPPAWVQFFDGYQATVDWPAAPFWSEISSAFPDGLILLSVQDADAWCKSVSNTIFPTLATYVAPDAPDDRWSRNPDEGWEPICAALHVDVPDQPFPHTNTTAQVREEFGLDPD